MGFGDGYFYDGDRRIDLDCFWVLGVEGSLCIYYVLYVFIFVYDVKCIKVEVYQCVCLMFCIVYVYMCSFFCKVLFFMGIFFIVSKILNVNFFVI